MRIKRIPLRGDDNLPVRPIEPEEARERLRVPS